MDERKWLLELIARLSLITLRVFILILFAIIFVYIIRNLMQKINKADPNKFVPENPEVLWECPECSNKNPNTTFTCNQCGYRIR